jgi:hypothetical protein
MRRFCRTDVSLVNCSFISGTVSNPKRTTVSDKMIVSNEFEIIWKGAVQAKFNTF